MASKEEKTAPPLHLEAASLLAAIVDSSDDAIVSKTLEGIITSWNKSAQRLLGYSPQEAIGQHITLIIPPDRISEEATILERIKRGERVEHFETVRRRKDGSSIHISLTISPVKDASGRIIGASKVARDITERLTLETERQKFVTLAGRCTEFIGMCDMEYKPFYVNEAALRLVGLASLEEVRSVQVADFFFPEDREFLVNEFFPKILRDGKGEAEIRFRHFKTGAAIWMIYNVFVINDSDGRPVALGTFSQNVTARKQAELAVLDSEARLRTLSAGLEKEILARTAELREVSARLLQIQDSERRHIARELHDTAGQTLTALSIHLSRIAQRAKPSAPELVPELEESQGLARQLSQEIRTASYLLHPPLLDESGVSAALRWYAEGVTKRSGLEIELDIPDDFERLDDDLSLVIFRLIQECLTNVLRHSASKIAVIRLARNAEGVTVEVEDHGRGIPAERLAAIESHGAGVGIQGMRERVRHFAGNIKIESSGRGTKISATLPIPRKSLASDEPAKLQKRAGL